MKINPFRRSGPDAKLRQKKRALIQYACGAACQQLVSATESLHRQYCARHGIDYRLILEDSVIGRHPTWRRIALLAEALRLGYDQVAWLDADCVIVDPSFDIFAASGFGIAVCECFDSPDIERHLNAGVMLTTRSPEVLAFLDKWDAMPAGGRWEDQSAFIELMATRPHRDLLTILPNRFNCLAVHMEARDPIIRAFHGDPERHIKLPALVNSITGTDCR